MPAAPHGVRACPAGGGGWTKKDTLLLSHNLFTQPLPTDLLKAEGVAFDLEANADERALIAHRLDLVGLAKLTAKGRVVPGEHGLIEVEGALEALLTQRCVVTLEPFADEAVLLFKRVFTTLPDAQPDEVQVDPEALDPEPVEAGMIDLGELVVEELAVGLNPYPKGPGAAEALREHGVLSEDEGVAARPAASGPFAALAAWRGRRGTG